MYDSSRAFIADMQQKMITYFDGEEVQTMSFLLGVDYDSLRGGTKPTKVNALLSHLSRSGRLPELLDYVAQQRTNVNWPGLPENFALPQGGAGSELDGATVFQIGTLNTQGGAFITGSQIDGSDFSNGKSVNGDEIFGRKNTLSGTFSGALVNIDSQLDRVNQSIQTLPVATADQQYQLSDLVAQLKDAFRSLPESNLKDATLISKRVEALAAETSSEFPDPEYIQDLLDSLKRMAEKLVVAAPLVASIINAIVDLYTTIAA